VHQPESNLQRIFTRLFYGLFGWKHERKFYNETTDLADDKGYDSDSISSLYKTAPNREINYFRLHLAIITELKAQKMQLLAGLQESMLI